MSQATQQKSKTTAVAKPTKTLKDWLQSDAFEEAVANASPKTFDAKRMLQIALVALNRTPKLQECDQKSFLNCLLQLSDFGLNPNGREAHLVPYGTECTLIIDYKGYVKMAYQSGLVKEIQAGVVHKGDEFDYETCRHVPWDWRDEDDRPSAQGDMIGAYAVVTLMTGGVHRERMTKAEVDSIRARSKAGSRGPWVTDYDEMAKKTAFRRATKWIPLSDEFRAALDADEDPFEAIDALSTRPASKLRGLAGLEARLESNPEAAE